MSEIIDMKDIVEQAPDDKAIASSEEYFRQLAKEIPGMEGLDALSAFLAMPDEAFEGMKPLMLEEMERGFNNSNDKYDMALALKMSGMSASDMRVALDKALADIDEKLSGLNESRKEFVKQVLMMATNAVQVSAGAHNRIIRIPIELCNEDAKIPTYAHDGDAGCDVYALHEMTLEPHQTTIMPLGFKVAVPAGYELQMRPRSGMSAKTKVRVANAPGTIDSSFRGEVGVILDNIGDYPFYITKGMRIAQMVLSEVPVASFQQVSDINEISTTDRGSGGYGSSGV